jgi:hypothetical protein
MEVPNELGDRYQPNQREHDEHRPGGHSLAAANASWMW